MVFHIIIISTIRRNFFLLRNHYKTIAVMIKLFWNTNILISDDFSISVKNLILWNGSSISA